MAIKEGTHIRTDKDTLEKLRAIAGDKPVAQLLRDIAAGQVTASAPVDALEVLRASIIKQFEEFKDKTHQYHEELLHELNDLSSELDMLNHAMRSNHKLGRELDKVITNHYKPSELDILNGQVCEIGLYDKIKDSGIDIWDADMYREVIANPTLLDDKDWLKSHRAWGG